MYEDVLLPYDGSDGAETVLHHAAELAHWDDATVHVLFVADTTRDSVTVVAGQPVDTLVQRGDTVVSEAESTLQSLGVDYRTDVVQGNPAPTITQYADAFGHDLVVMPTHGRAGISRYLIGSVTEKVVRLSDVPVLTARMRPDERLTFPYERVLIPTDGSPASVAAATHGLALAATLDAAVHVLAVVDDTSLGAGVRSVLSDAELERPATAAVEAVLAAADDYELSHVDTSVAHGPPAEEIQAHVETNTIHAVVMGASGRRGVDRILLGSVAEQTVRSAPVPVITVHDRS